MVSSALRWVMENAGKPIVSETFDPSSPEPGEVVVEVAGCGVCHTDLGFFYDGVPIRHALPLTLGHEISGRVVAAKTGGERQSSFPPSSPAANAMPVVVVATLSARGRKCQATIFTVDSQAMSRCLLLACVLSTKIGWQVPDWNLQTCRSSRMPSLPRTRRSRGQALPKAFSRS